MTDAERLQERIDRASALHRPTPFHLGRHRCVRCKENWPCETARILAPDAVWPACEECIRAEAAKKAHFAEATPFQSPLYERAVIRRMVADAARRRPLAPVVEFQ